MGRRRRGILTCRGSCPGWGWTWCRQFAAWECSATSTPESREVTVTQCRQTVSLSHHHTVSLSHYHTATLCHCHTTTLPHCVTVTLPHCHTVTLCLCHFPLSHISQISPLGIHGAPSVPE